jgi:hypothetical protein
MFINKIYAYLISVGHCYPYLNLLVLAFAMRVWKNLCARVCSPLFTTRYNGFGQYAVGDYYHHP